MWLFNNQAKKQRTSSAVMPVLPLPTVPTHPSTQEQSGTSEPTQPHAANETHQIAADVTNTVSAPAAAPTPKLNGNATAIPQPQEGVIPGTIAPSQEAMSAEAVKTIEAMRKKAKRKRKAIIVGIIVLFIIAVCAIAGNMLLSNASKPHQTQQTAFVTKQNFTATIKAQGQAQPVSSTYITPEIQGIVDKVYVTEGSQVKKGDTLFTIKNQEIDDAIEAANDQLAVAKKQLASAKDGKVRAQAAYDTALKAYNSAKTQQEQAALPHPDTVFEQVVSASNACDQAQLQVKNAQKQLDKAKEHAAKRTVTSPISGSVLTLGVKQGASTAMGAGQNSMPGASQLMQIADISKMRVRVAVSELDISHIEVGQPASVTFNALEHVQCDATVENISNTTEVSAQPMPNDRESVAKYMVDVIITNPDPAIRVGMSSEVTITTKNIPDALCVPSAAVYERDGANYVRVVRGDSSNGESETTECAITVVARSSNTCVIEGLEEGSEVEIES